MNKKSKLPGDAEPCYNMVLRSYEVNSSLLKGCTHNSKQKYLPFMKADKIDNALVFRESAKLLAFKCTLMYVHKDVLKSTFSTETHYPFDFKHLC